MTVFMSLLGEDLDSMLRSSAVEEAAHLQVLCREDEVDLLAVGLPVNADGTEGPMAVAARRYAADLTAALHIPHVLVDERYTSQEAEEYLRETHPKDTRKRRHMRDRVAAGIILKTFLEHGPVEGGDS